MERCAKCHHWVKLQMEGKRTGFAVYEMLFLTSFFPTAASKKPGLRSLKGNDSEKETDQLCSAQLQIFNFTSRHRDGTASVTQMNPTTSLMAHWC